MIPQITKLLLVPMMLVSCTISASKSRLEPKRTNPTPVLAEEEWAISTKNYNAVVDRAYTRKPNSLKPFLDASLTLDELSAAGSEGHYCFTLPAVLQQWNDEEISKCCDKFTKSERQLLAHRFDHNPRWRQELPLTAAVLPRAIN